MSSYGSFQPTKASPTANPDEETVLAIHAGCEGRHCGKPPGTPSLLTCSNRQRETVRSTGLCPNGNLSGFRHQLFPRSIFTVRKATKPRLLDFLPKQQLLSSRSDCKQVSLSALPMSCPIIGLPPTLPLTLDGLPQASFHCADKAPLTTTPGLIVCRLPQQNQTLQDPTAPLFSSAF